MVVNLKSGCVDIQDMEESEESMISIVLFSVMLAHCSTFHLHENDLSLRKQI